MGYGCYGSSLPIPRPARRIITRPIIDGSNVPRRPATRSGIRSPASALAGPTKRILERTAGGTNGTMITKNGSKFY